MKEERGSEKLANTPSSFEQSEIAELLEISTSHARVLDWCMYGQPGIDRVCGTLSVKPESIGVLVEQLIKTERPRVNIDVFPLGMPPRIDEIRVQVRGGNF